MYDGVRLAVQLLDRESTVAIGFQDGHHALVVGCHRDRGRAVPVDISHLGVAHAAELSTEVGFPKGLDVSGLAWVMAKQDNVLPIAGTTRLANLKTNVASMDLTLDAADMSLLDQLADQVQGTRYNEQGMTLLNG